MSFSNSDSFKNIQMFTDKMILSTSQNQKEILLWAENSGTIAFSYNDENLRTYIPNNKIRVIDSNLFSEFFIYLHENKSIFNIWDTSSTQFYTKFSVTDEKISCFEISYDKIFLFVGSFNGNLFIYNLSCGLLIKSIKLSNNEIIKIKCVKNFVLILNKEKLSLYLFGNVIQGKKELPKEIFFFENTNGNYNNFITYNRNYIFLYGDTFNILQLKLEDLQVCNSFLIENLNHKIENLIINDNTIYFSNNTLEIFSFQLNDYKLNETHNIKLTKDNSILIQNVKNLNSNISVFILGTRNNIITGHEDGKICIWINKSKVNPFFTFEKMYQIHKGKITNLLLINKPISQYGLNFNKNLQECIISNKQIKELKDVKIKQNDFFEKEIENYITNYNIHLIEEGIVDNLKTGKNICVKNINEDEIINSEKKGKKNNKKIIDKYINNFQ